MRIRIILNPKRQKLKILRLEGCRLTTTGIMNCSVEEKLRFGKKSLIQRFLQDNLILEELNLQNNDLCEVSVIEVVNQLNPSNSLCSLK